MATILLRTTMYRIYRLFYYNRIFVYLTKDLYKETMSIFSIKQQRKPVGENFDEADANRAAQILQDERRAFIEDLGRNFKLETINFCSIGPGFGGEKYLLEGRVKKLVLVEPDYDTCSYLQKKFRSEKTILVNKYIEDYKTDIVFDIIYTSGPSNWVFSSPWSGIPDVFIRFINTNLGSDGIFIARIYAGLHPRVVIRSKVYIEGLMECLRKNGLRLVTYAYKYTPEHQEGFLVVCREDSQLEASGIVFSEPGVAIVRDGQFIARIKIPRREKARNVLGLLVYVPARILLNTANTFRNVVDIVRINVKFLKE